MSAATIHVCDAACPCGGRCSETQALRDLIARSSLGSPEVVALRESIPPELAERALRRAAEMERDAAIAERDALRHRILALADSLKEENRPPDTHPPEPPAGSDQPLDAMVERAHPDDASRSAELDSRVRPRIGFWGAV